MKIQAIMPALPPSSGRAPFANNQSIETLRNIVLPKVYDKALKEIIFDEFVTLSPKRQKGFLARLFKNNPNSSKCNSLREEGRFQVVNTLYNKPGPAIRGFRERIEAENAEKLRKALTLR